jgi:gamma-glutamyltranspeptidase/glutathione hydrolase
MRRYYADRSRWLGDPDFAAVPTAKLLDPAYIASRRATIDPSRASTSAEIGPGTLAAAVHEGSETTHYNVVDDQGNAVSVTYTLNAGYGSGVTARGTGILLNDEMDDFAAKPGTPNMFGLVQGEANAIQPGKRPLSSMTPTIVTRNGKLFMVAGGPGGSHIISNLFQVMVNVLDFDMNIQDAIDWPRVHQQWLPDKLEAERGVSPDTFAILEKYGYRMERHGDAALIDGIVAVDGSLEGGVDGRGDDSRAEGY